MNLTFCEFINAYLYVTTHIVRLNGSEKQYCRTLVEISDLCIKHGFKMRFFLTVFSLQPKHLSSYTYTNNDVTESPL